MLFSTINDEQAGKTTNKQRINDMIKKNIKTIFLEVGQNNIAAINLYLKFGFEQYGIRKEYYKNKENAILMKRQIKD